VTGAGAALLGTAALGRGRPAGAEATPTRGVTRTVEHALGVTEVPAAPRRYLILDNTVTIGYAASLGMLPAFALEQDLGRQQPFPEDLYPAVEAVEPIPGDFSNINLEAIVAAKPDLIVGAAGYFDDVYDRLSEIAPTVALAYAWQDPWVDMGLLADALGAPERVAPAKRRVDEAIVEVRTRVSGQGRTVSFGAVWNDGSVMVYGPTFVVPILAAIELGYELVPDFAAVDGTPGEMRVNVSAERVTELSSDYLVLLQATNSPEEQAAVDEMLARPLFQALPAVRDDRVLVVSRLTAVGAAGVDGWLTVLDQMATLFSR